MTKDKEHILIKDVMYETDTPEYVAKYLLEKSLLRMGAKKFIWREAGEEAKLKNGRNLKV